MEAAITEMLQIPAELTGDLSSAPFEFERVRDYEKAAKAHDLAISKLLALVNKTKDKNIKDIANQRIAFHRQRKAHIQKALDGTLLANSLLILPTLKGAIEELKTFIPNTEGKSFISSVSNILRYSS